MTTHVNQTRRGFGEFLAANALLVYAHGTLSADREGWAAQARGTALGDHLATKACRDPGESRRSSLGAVTALT